MLLLACSPSEDAGGGAVAPASSFTGFCLLVSCELEWMQSFVVGIGGRVEVDGMVCECDWAGWVLEFLLRVCRYGCTVF